MDKIDLDSIIDRQWTPGNMEMGYDEIKSALKEAIRQALVLASEKVIVSPYFDSDGCYREGIYLLNKQSILDIEKLIV